jgi:DNA-binding NtrC family response regulator
MNLETNSHARVVIVDDEEMVITSLKAFLQLETDYDVRGFTDPQEAARYLENAEADVVVSDYLMPKMNGLELLARARDLQAEAGRVLLTGHADKQSAVDAINRVGLFQYVEKPWDNAQLLLVIKAAIERTQLLRTLRDKISQLDTAHANLKQVQRRLLEAFL